MAKSKSVNSKRMVAGSALRVLPLDEIGHDPSYQREPLDQSWRRIVADFDPVALGIPVVGEREDGSKWVVDGLQRLTALRKMEKREVRAEVFASDGPEHEASVFRKINKLRTALKPLQIFRAMLTEGDATAWLIKNVAEEYGLEIPANSGPHTGGGNTPEKVSINLSCINAVQRVYRRGDEVALRFVLSTMRKLKPGEKGVEVWPGDPQRLRDTIVLGLFKFWADLEGTVDQDRLIDRLNTTTPAKVMYQASLGVGDKTANAADVILRLYNKRYGSKSRNGG
jgi:hypothetical protein